METTEHVSPSLDDTKTVVRVVFDFPLEPEQGQRAQYQAPCLLAVRAVVCLEPLADGLGYFELQVGRATILAAAASGFRGCGWLRSRVLLRPGDLLTCTAANGPGERRRFRLEVAADVVVRCDCGSTVDVTFGPDPYSSEIHGDDTPLWICAACREQRAADV